VTSEHKKELKIETESEFELESVNFDLDQSAVNWTSSPISQNLEPTNLIPSSIKPSPFIELKPLSKHLKYIYKDEQETLPIIIASYLTAWHEEILMSVLSKHKKVVGLYPTSRD